MAKTKRRRGAKFDIDYWALEEDPAKLAESCYERVKGFYESVRSSYYWSRIARNWLYYHGLYFEGGASFDWTAVQNITDDIIGVGVNHFRNLLEHIYTIVTQQRLSLDARAKQGDTKSLEQAKIGKNIVDHYRREVGAEEHLKRAVRHALVMQTGYVHSPWDPFSGVQKVVTLEPDANELNLSSEFSMGDNNEPESEIVPQGEFDISNPTVWDVVFDPGVREWERNNWLLVRTYENRYDLASQQDDEQIAQQILDEDLQADWAQETMFDLGSFGNSEDMARTSDIIPVWNFYHRKSHAASDGRSFRFISDGIPLGEPGPLKYDRMPVFRIIPGETLMTQLGYSPANDLQGPQELLNAEVSMIATNHQGAGFSAIWKPPGCKLSEEDMGDGVFLLEGGQAPPQGVSFQANSPDHERFSNFLMRTQEQLSGVNSVARGQPEANLKSGEALKVMDAKATMSAAPIKESFARCVEDWGTFTVRTLRDTIDGDQERLVSIAGENKISSVSYFTKNDLEGIDRIIVDIANPTTDTISGKMWMAEQLLQRGMISTPQEFVTVTSTGNIDPLLHADEAQLTRLHAENDNLSRGLPVEVAAHTDNHTLDIREHAALMSRPEVRENGQLAANIGAHIAQHIQALMDPQVQWMMAALGYPAPPPLMPVGMSAGGPTPPAGQAGPKPSNGSGQAPANQQGPGEPSKAGPGGDMGRYPQAQPAR